MHIYAIGKSILPNIHPLYVGMIRANLQYNRRLYLSGNPLNLPPKRAIFIGNTRAEVIETLLKEV